MQRLLALVVKIIDKATEHPLKFVVFVLLCGTILGGLYLGLRAKLPDPLPVAVLHPSTATPQVPPQPSSSPAAEMCAPPDATKPPALLGYRATSGPSQIEAISDVDGPLLDKFAYHYAIRNLDTTIISVRWTAGKNTLAFLRILPNACAVISQESQQPSRVVSDSVIVVEELSDTGATAADPVTGVSVYVPAN